MADNLELTEKEVNVANAQEENERLNSEVTRLRKRVVLLRAMLNRAYAEPAENVDTKITEEN